ncbi:MAG: DMT family transporter [Rhodospirillales bacterium]|nr:DMT family transporter [Rhodospirillales bacterium]
MKFISSLELKRPQFMESAGKDAPLPASYVIQSFLLLVGIVVILGVNWPIMKFALDSYTPLWFVSIRFFMGAIIIVVILMAMGRGFRLPPREDIPVVLSVGLLQNLTLMGLSTVALNVVPAGRCAVLVYTTPIWIVAMQLLFLKERPSAARLWALPVSVIGVLFFMYDDLRAVAGGAPLWGYGLLLIAACAWGLSMILVSKHKWKGGSFDVAPWQMLIASLPMAVIAFIWDGSPLGAITFDWNAAWTLSFTGGLATGFGFWAVVEAGRRYSPETLSNAMMLSPVFGLVASMIMTGERVSVPVLFGAVLILVSIWLAINRQKRGGNTPLKTGKTGGAKPTVV